ncbi:hypothetical protein Bdiaspc4_19590 [Bradyrhizobium diazoefficiens]|nr:hypothetical protein Bdiaspc4_19590 [Bradyrhizobium diazoefficiens]
MIDHWCAPLPQSFRGTRKREPGISRFSGAQWRTIVRSCGPPRNDSIKTTPARPISRACRSPNPSAPGTRRR